jgi:hypothetical protein
MKKQSRSLSLVLSSAVSVPCLVLHVGLCTSGSASSSPYPSEVEVYDEYLPRMTAQNLRTTSISME